MYLLILSLHTHTVNYHEHMSTSMQLRALTDMPTHVHNARVVHVKVRNPGLEKKA